MKRVTAALWDEGVPHPLPVPEADQRRSLDGQHLRPARVGMVASHAARLRDHHMHLALAGEVLGIECLKHGAATILMDCDRFDLNAHRRVSPHPKREPPRETCASRGRPKQAHRHGPPPHAGNDGLTAPVGPGARSPRYRQEPPQMLGLLLRTCEILR
jgi:hypothetical protein